MALQGSTGKPVPSPPVVWNMGPVVRACTWGHARTTSVVQAWVYWPCRVNKCWPGTPVARARYTGVSSQTPGVDGKFHPVSESPCWNFSTHITDPPHPLMWC